MSIQLPNLETGSDYEATEIILLRHILDALVGGNEPVMTKITSNDSYVVEENTAHSLVITAINKNATYSVSSVSLTILAGTTIYLNATKTFTKPITITAGSTGEVHILEMRSV